MDERILVPLDGSPLSYRALRHALDTFPDHEIVVLHVRDLFEPWHGRGGESVHEHKVGSDEWDAVEKEVEEAVFSEAREIASEFDRELTTDSDIGDPQRIIPDYAADEGINHIVIGVHGREDQERTMFGRVAETVVFRSPVPVTVMR